LGTVSGGVGIGSCPGNGGVGSTIGGTVPGVKSGMLMAGCSFAGLDAIRTGPGRFRALSHPWTHAAKPAKALLMTEIEIDVLGRDGDGIARLGTHNLYVPFTLPGERLIADYDGERGTLAELLRPSPDRVAPPCPYFGTCGGCALQHMAPAAYQAFKRQLVADALRHADISTDIAPLVDATASGRRRATLHIRKEGTGYMRARSHDVLDIARCLILAPGLAERAPAIARALGPLTGASEAAFTLTDTGIDLSIKSERKLKPQPFAEFAQKAGLARFVFNGEAVYMSRPPTVRMGKSLVEIPPASFLQATASAEDALAALVVAGVGAAKSVADLFSGAGPFALRLAEQSRVYAADSDRPAIAALQKAVNHTRGLKPVTAQVRDLFRDPLAPIELKPFDAVVFDPPRAGAEKQAAELARSAVKTVVGVSCDPKSFARDAAILIAGGYRLTTVTPVDQFAFSTHVELVGVFRR
jgi:23S rRNA (uracil1939-C5)-methyltransferase